MKYSYREIQRLERLNSTLSIEKRYYHTLFTCLLDEINENQMRAVTMINGLDQDLTTIRFYEGQLVVLDRILKSIDYEEA
jgi:hypothetical protein